MIIFGEHYGLLEVITEEKRHSTGIHTYKGFIDLASVEELRVQKTCGENEAMIVLLDKNRRQIGILPVPANRADQLGHKIIELASLSKAGRIPALMIKYQDEMFQQYDPEKGKWGPLRV